MKIIKLFCFLIILLLSSCDENKLLYGRWIAKSEWSDNSQFDTILEFNGNKFTAIEYRMSVIDPNGVITHTPNEFFFVNDDNFYITSGNTSFWRSISNGKYSIKNNLMELVFINGNVKNYDILINNNFIILNGKQFNQQN